MASRWMCRHSSPLATQPIPQATVCSLPDASGICLQLGIQGGPALRRGKFPLLPGKVLLEA